jgi:GntR family transcriptional regulator/MocR family aminotransferase
MVARRCHALLEALRLHFGDAVEWTGSDAGLLLLIWIHGLRAGKPLQALVARAARAGVGVYPASGCFLTPPKRAGLLLGYAGVDESGIREGIARLARVARSRT